MALKSNQTQLSLNTLYEIKNTSAKDERSIADMLWINSGSVDIYGHDGATQPTTLSEMTLNTSDTDKDGTIEVSRLPRYIALAQNTGTSTEIIATAVNSLEVIDLGVIS